MYVYIGELFMKIRHFGLLLISSLFVLGGCNVEVEQIYDDGYTDAQISHDIKELLDAKQYDYFTSVENPLNMLLFFDESYSLESCLEELKECVPEYMVKMEDVHKTTVNNEERGYMKYKTPGHNAEAEFISEYDTEDPMGPYSVNINVSMRE